MLLQAGDHLRMKSSLRYKDHATTVNSARDAKFNVWSVQRDHK